MLNKILAISVAVTLANAVYASENNIPNKCPSIASIVSAGLDLAEPFEGDIWVGSKSNNTYDTNESWTFGIMFVEAKTQAEAYEELLKAMTFLVPKNQVPERNDKGYVCWYQGNFKGVDTYGVAFTPPQSFKSILKFAK